MSTSTDDGSVEDKAARALAAAHAFLARSPVPARGGGNKPTVTNGKDDDVKVDNGLKRAAGGVDAALKTTKTTLERSGSSTATSVATTTNSASRSDVRTRLEKEFDDATVPQREDASAVSVATNASKTTASTASTNDRAEHRGETGSDVEEAAVTSPERVVVEMDGTKDGLTTSKDGRNDVVAGGEGRGTTTTTEEVLDPEPTLGEPPNRRPRAPPTPGSVNLELSESEGESSAAEDSDGEVVESPVTFARVINVVDEDEEAERSDSEGVFRGGDRARARSEGDDERDDADGERRSGTAKDMEISSLKEEIERLNAELESMRWGREALETRAVEAERAVAEMQGEQDRKGARSAKSAHRRTGGGASRLKSSKWNI
jgi:hypothetical protein